MQLTSMGAIASVATGLIGQALFGATITVPGMAPNIKAAVNMASSGDEIVVGAGTWSGVNNRDVHLLGKQLWIHSASGPTSCIVDAGGLGRGLILDGGEASGTTIEGITFRNCRSLGFTQTGGAILVAASSTLAILDCVFESNTTDLNGRGGAIANSGSLSIDGAVFRQNVAYYYGGRGGAIYNTASATLSVNACEFAQNAGNEAAGGAIANEGTASVVATAFLDNTGYSGGALWNSGALTVHDCTFTSNGDAYTYGGGAVGIFGGNATFESCTFVGNVTALTSGGGGCVSVSAPAHASLRACRMVGGSAGTNGGGGVLVNGGTVEIADSVFDGCSSWVSGGGLRAIGGVVDVTGCTFAQNTVTSAASGGGGGVFVNVNATAHLRNTIIWANTAAGATGQSAQIAVAIGAAWSVDFCCIQSLDGSLGGSGNFADDPLFVSMLGADGVKGTLDDDLALTATSPCIDRGDSALVPASSTTDVIGAPRIADGDGDGFAIVDVGAHEHANPLDLTGDGLVTGSDLGALLGLWGSSGPLGDFDGSGAVDAADLAVLLGGWTIGA